MKRFPLIIAVFAIAIVAPGCGASPTPTAVPTPVLIQVVATPVPQPPTPVPSPTSVPTITPTPAPLTLAALKNAEYQNEFVTGGKAKLTDGVYKESGAPGAATQVEIRLSDAAVLADLDGDGVGEAAVILSVAPSASGTFYYLAVLTNQNSVPQHVASFLLGDRVQVKGMTFQNGEIVVNMIAHGARDPICCPTLAATRRYKFQNNKLIALTAPAPTQVAVAAPTLGAGTTPAPAVTVSPKATATFPKPPAPKGFVAYRFNDHGVDRVAMVNVEDRKTLPLFDVGPVLDLVENTGASPLAWSPDNSKIAYVSTVSLGGSNSLRLYDAAANTTVGVTSGDAGGGLSSPTWSPDGKQIAFVLLTGNKLGWAINIVNADRTPCAEGSQRCTVYTNVQNEQFRGGLSWSKNGLFALGMNTTGKNDIFTLNRDGGGLRNLTNHVADDSTPVWSPDGKSIAFTSRRDGREQIYVMNADGTGLRRLSQTKDKDFSPTWSPDGNWIAFASFRGAQTDIYVMDTHGGNVSRLTTVGTADHPAWSR
ncbi:MAG: hypothetical protein AB1817_19025 [Chloroflexota bacterium]